jgi:hypothetical protein
MPKFGSWGLALRSLGYDDCDYPLRDTVESYRHILEDLGLETVFWESHRFNSKSEAIKHLPRIARFIKKHQPCLFIYQPIKPNINLKKEYLVGLTNQEPVREWIEENEQFLSQYFYLVTTQITNPGNGFVGSCFSDGRGSMYVETYHKPGVCIQPELSMPKEEIGKFIDRFTVDGFRIETWNGRFLSEPTMKKLIEMYSDKKGYFEFVCGVQSGKTGIYTTGHDIGTFFNFPCSLADSREFQFGLKVMARVANPSELSQ